jgi:hypothetical protein
MDNRRSHNFINMSGFKTGRLYVTDVFEIRKDVNLKSRVFWKCNCECGTSCFILGRNLRLGYTKSCGCLQKDGNYARCKSRILPFGIGARNIVLKTYKDNARLRNLNWNLSVDDFGKLTSQNCAYCNAEPSTIQKSRSKDALDFIYNGIDRADNSRGYEIDNVVTCCKICNRAKDVLTKQEFLDWIGRVYNHAVK